MLKTLNRPVQTIIPPGAFEVANLGGGQARTDFSRDWMSRPYDQRFLDLDSLLEHVRTRADRAKETVIKTSDLLFRTPEITNKLSTEKLFIDVDGDELSPSHYVFGQLCGLANAPASYLRSLPSPIVAQNLNYGIRYLRRADEVKAYNAPDLLHAMTGPDYGRIYDWEVVEAVRNFTAGTNWKIPGVMDWRTMIYDPNTPVTKETTTLYASDRDVGIFLVDDLHPVEVGKVNGKPDLMFRGFYVKNSEVGAGTMALQSFYLRSLCQNRIFWGVEGFEELKIRHTKNAPARFLELARPALESFAQGSSKTLVEAVNAAKGLKLAKNDESAMDFLKGMDFSKKQSEAIFAAVETEEGRKPRTAWDFAQGITAVARSIPHTDKRVELEQTATRILDKVKIAA